MFRLLSIYLHVDLFSPIFLIMPGIPGESLFHSLLHVSWSTPSPFFPQIQVDSRTMPFSLAIWTGQQPFSGWLRLAEVPTTTGEHFSRGRSRLAGRLSW